MVSSRRLPPIAALRAFEAAARHLSFTRTAAELNITQSAVSHQIRHLEDLWGLQLFHRRSQGLALSEPAQRLAPVLSQFFNRMDVLLGELSARHTRGALRVSVTQSFAVTWLVPRLGAFRDAHPDINIWISADDRPIDFSAGDADMGIRLGRTPFRGLHAKLLLREHVFPVCSPRLVERLGMPSSPADLLRLPLLLRIDERHAMTWRDWFRHTGFDVPEPTDGPSFPNTSLAVQAARDGLGVALVRSAHMGDDLSTGRLVRLLDVPCPSDLAYFAVCPLGAEEHPKVKAFCLWLTREAAVAQARYDAESGSAETPVLERRRPRETANVKGTRHRG